MTEKPKNMSKDEQDDETDEEALAEEQRRKEGNPPWTTIGKMTAPKFGSAGSGGAEYEPGPPKN
jgi:hypothetical protein